MKTQPPFVNGKQQPPSKAEIKRDEPLLLKELALVQPQWIIAVGRVAAQWFLPGTKVNMETMHGLGYLAGTGAPLPFAASMAIVVPVYHPAAALHNPELAPLVQWDIQRAGQYIRNEVTWTPAVDKWAGGESYYRGTADSFICLPSGGLTAIDTEGTLRRPWGLSVSTQLAEAGVYKPGEVRSVNPHCPRTLMHNALWDMPVLRAMGVTIPWETIEDTFLMSYCLRVVPMGLKALAKRFCGMDMQSYQSIVGEADKRLVMQWVANALEAKRCPCCEGTGKVQLMKKNGSGLKKGPERCPYPGCESGGLWDPRPEGWAVGRYLRSFEKELTEYIATKLSRGDAEAEAEADAETDEEEDQRSRLKKRVENWPPEVIKQIEAEVGPMPEVSLDDVDEKIAVDYSARDADATRRLYPLLKEQIEALDLTNAYRLDLSVLPVAEEMMRTGMRIDCGYFEKFSKELAGEKDQLLDELASLSGRRINPASGDQVAELLFEKGRYVYSLDDARDYWQDGFDIAPEKYTPSRKRGTTNDKTLEGLKLKYSADRKLVQVVDFILGYRLREKAKGFCDKLVELADIDSRVHTEIKPCRTATFRWASSNPNLQQIPIRQKLGTDIGKRVRQGFIASPGFTLGSWDFDQIEMRVMAAMSQDENLLRVFREGLDIHTMTASLVFRVPLGEVTKDQRASAKNIGFGIIYGVTPKGLRAQMDLRGQNWSESECKDLIDSYLYTAYPGVGRFMMDAHAEARQTGMVRSMFGHLRYCPNVHSTIDNVREEALRQAANFKIQCSAAELLKKAMRDLWRDGKELLDEVGSRWLMAVHDELLFEVPDNPRAKAITDTLVESYMTNPLKLEGVHVGTTGKYASDWSMLK